MIDAERLLGKVLAGAMSGTGRRRKGKTYRKSDDLIGGLLGGLTSGKGLVTAIGLGIGAYEILKNKSAATAGPTTGPPPYQPPVPPVQASSATVPPAAPPPLPNQQAAPPAPGYPETQDLAVRLIQTMVAAAHADGMLDEEEERRILEKLQQDQGLDSEEKQFLLAQLHAPRAIEELVAGIDRQTVAQTMYSLAVATITIDTPEERQWLDNLAAGLSLSNNVKRFIEEGL